ncbi:tRNA-specific 2-thiouridylase [Candidatus Hodgkinia cicadicola]|nr:tRNA-specific 2-thiouridylase [Candidatus Hodgkinia cicadicola]
MWKSKHYTRKVLMLASGGVDSQCVSLIIKTKRLDVNCVNCVLHKTVPVSQLQIELANMVCSQNLRLQVVLCFEQFSRFVKLTEKQHMMQGAIAPCIMCNIYLKSVICSTLDLTSAPASGHYVRLTNGVSNKVINSINRVKSQLYFINKCVWMLCPSGWHYKSDIKQCHASFKSQFKQSNGLCYGRRRRQVGANPSGCWVSNNAVWQESCASARLRYTNSNAAHATTSSSPLVRRTAVFKMKNVVMVRVNEKLRTGQCIHIMLSSNRNAINVSNFYVSVRNFKKRSKLTLLNSLAT